MPLALAASVAGRLARRFLLLAIVFVLSSFLDNIAGALIGGAMARSLFKQLHIGYLAAIVAASNAGGAGSVVGDTTTTMMWIDGVRPTSCVPGVRRRPDRTFRVWSSGLAAAAALLADRERRPAPPEHRLDPRRDRDGDARRRDRRQRHRQRALAGASRTRFPFIGVAVWVVILRLRADSTARTGTY